MVQHKDSAFAYVVKGSPQRPVNIEDHLAIASFSYDESFLMVLTHFPLAVWGLCCCVGSIQLQRVDATLQLGSAGSPLQRLLSLQSRLQGAWTSVAVAHGLRCPVACAVFPDQGSNPCLLHWQVDSLPLDHRGNL